MALVAVPQQQEKPAEPQREPPSPNEGSVLPQQGPVTPVTPLFQPVQTVQTERQLASGQLVVLGETAPIRIVPKVDNEVYGIDIVDSAGRIIYMVNAHSGEFRGQLPLPKGQYTYYLRTQKNDMPFTVIFE